MRGLLAVCALLLPGIRIGAQTSPQDDVPIVIRGATIHDGTGQPGYVGDVHIRVGKIVAVGNVGKVPMAREIQATGLVVCPGFIDLHTHCDPGLVGTTGKQNKNYIMQGCTTVVTGNCGSGPVDAGEFFRKLEASGVGTNVIHLAPHNSIRAQVMGNANRPPTAKEQEAMESLVDKAMKDGTWGLSTGLIYNPGTYAKTEEIIGLAKVAGRHGGIYASHIRNEGSGLLTAIEEAIRIGREGNCHVHISHIKASGRSAWGMSSAAVELIEKARKDGRAVTADQYPYIASSTSLRATVVPSRYREGTNQEIIERLDDPKTGPRMKEDIARQIGGKEGARRLQIARYEPNPKWNGKSIAAIAEAEKREPLEIVLEIERHGGAQIVNFGMNEEDVRVYMKRDWVATASDGGVQFPGGTVPHPRSYGTFPRKIGRYAIEDGIVTLEQAIRSSSGLPAEILKLKDRGLLKAGYAADVVVFDPKTYRDTATFDKPHQYAAGVKSVFVNGREVVSEGKHRPEVLAGKVLRHSK